MSVPGRERLRTSDREIVVARAIDAPREVVFEAFTTSEHLGRWWGPTGFTNVTRSFEFAVGGEWVFTMRGPDEAVYPEWITWTEITPSARISMLHGQHPGDPKTFESLLTFEDVENSTRVVLRTIFPTRAQRDEAAEKYHAIEGGEQTLAGLDSYVVAFSQREDGDR